ncbi:MAG: hypothetical protein ROR55_19755 [Devosia sp.]
MSLRIVRPDTAFADTGRRNKRPRAHEVDHLAFIRGLPCLCCHARPPSEAAHIRMADRRFAKRATGMAERPDDRWAVPLCSMCHREGPDAQHRANEAAWWREQGIDAVVVAAALHAYTGDEESARDILKMRGVRSDALTTRT